MMGKLPPDLEGHPLAHSVVRLAAERGVDLGDPASLARILSEVDGMPVDARTVLLMADAVERIVRFDRSLSAALRDTVPPRPCANGDVTV